MPKALSLDLRTRIAAAVAGGETVRAVAARFQASPSSAVRLGQELRAGTGLAPAKRGGPRPSPITAVVADWLRARLSEKPDLTMRALAAELRDQGTPVTHDTVWRFVRRAGLTVKKDADRAGVGRLLDHFSPGECAAYLHHAGYAPITA